MYGSDHRFDPAVHPVSDLRSDTTLKLRYGIWKTLKGLGQTIGQTRSFVVGSGVRGLSSGLTP